MGSSVILLIETATKNCSVALCRDGHLLIELSESADQFIHAEKLHTLIRKAILESHLKWSDIAAVAVSKGPGSYTGLRIGVSAAKGLAFALDIPLIAINTLELMSSYARQLQPGLDIYCALLDARRDEVYMAACTGKGEIILATSSVILGENAFLFSEGKKCCFIGDGVQKSMHLLPEESIQITTLPSAAMMTAIATDHFQMGKFENTDSFEPFYLKDFIPGISKQSILG
jgi:tRNA threonylcarbamoyladenosine biosynthesis protein TsaB